MFPKTTIPDTSHPSGHVHSYFRGGWPFRRHVHPAVAMFFEAIYANIADASVGRCADVRFFRQIDPGFSHATMDLDVNTMFGRSPQVQVQFANTHVHFDTAKRDRAKVQVRFAGTQISNDVPGNLVIQPHSPLVFDIVYKAAARWLFYFHVGAQAGDVGCESGGFQEATL